MKMKRNLVAVAVTSAVGATAVVAVTPVMADATAYGRAQVEVVSTNYDDKDAKDGISMVDNSQGQFGLKASEDLGNGWTALAKFEFKVDTVDNDVGAKPKSKSVTTLTTTVNATATTKTTTTLGGLSVTARETMVGLKNDAVQVELGNLKQAYKYAGGVTYDPFVATVLEARGNEGMTGKVGDLINAGLKSMKYSCSGCGNANDFGHASFIDNAIAIQGGSGPIKARLNYGPSEGDGSYGLAVTFEQDAFEVGVAATNTGDKLGDAKSTGNPDLTIKYSSNKLFGQYRMGPHKVSLQYEAGKVDYDVDSYNVKTTYIDYNMKMGNNLFDIALGQTDYDCSGDGCKPKFTRVAVRHSMSKTSSLFAGYRKTDADGAKDRESVISVGLRQDF